jgi:hypothetical protein
MLRVFTDMEGIIGAAFQVAGDSMEVASDSITVSFNTAQLDRMFFESESGNTQRPESDLEDDTDISAGGEIAMKMSKRGGIRQTVGFRMRLIEQFESGSTRAEDIAVSIHSALESGLIRSSEDIEDCLMEIEDFIEGEKEGDEFLWQKLDDVKEILSEKGLR